MPLEALEGHRDDRITYVTSDAKERLGMSTLLMRPDGFVAWASKGAPNLGEAAQTASRWFGTPDMASGST